MKMAIVIDKVVVGISTMMSSEATASAPPGADAYEVDDNADVKIGYTVSRPGNVLTFSPPEE